MGDAGDFFQDVIDVGMSPINTLVVDPLKEITGISGAERAGERASEAATQAAATQAAAQQQALEYLKQREEIPQALREQALMQIGSIYGIPMPGTQAPGGAFGDLSTAQMAATPLPEGWTGGEPFAGLPGFQGVGSVQPAGQAVGGMQPGTTGDFSGQQALIERAMQSPLYQSMLGGREAGEEAILRSAAATGGLRSGNVQEALYDYNTQLQNQALLNAYNEQLSGLQGLAGLPSNAAQIAQGIAGIGQTQAQGQIASAQAQQIAQQQGFGNLMGLGQLGLLGYALFSDRRLKKNIKKIDEVNGFNWYTWDWNIVANNMGLKGECMGCMADEVYEKKPEAVIMKDGFLMVCYDKLGIIHDNRGTA